ncbi:hypothetical protein Y032_0609g612 [Ancylostoma ceylanicum]|nr:hypothetical protein Y032_0609g612 [Ancylostoma ceylanicum]
MNCVLEQLTEVALNYRRQAARARDACSVRLNNFVPAGDFRSTTEAANDAQQKTPAPTPTMEESKEDTENAAPAKPTSRLVRPPNRVIHTAPQGPTANRTQSVTRPR